MTFAFGIVAVIIFAVSVVTGGIESKLSESSDVAQKKKSKVLVNGLCKTVFAVATTFLAVMIPTSLLIAQTRPAVEDIMPAYMYSGDVDLNMVISDEEIESLIESCEEVAKNNPNRGYYDLAFIYFKTANFDYAVDALLKCDKIKTSWEYAYDLGVAYGYTRDYTSAIKYLKIALQSDGIPIRERGAIYSNLSMIESYYGTWLYTLLK